MKANYLIFAGLFLRYMYYWSNDTYTMEYLKTKLWKTIVFSILVTILFWYIAFFAHIQEKMDDDLQIAFLMLGYVAVGWAVDSFFLAIMKWYEGKFKSKIEGWKS